MATLEQIVTSVCERFGAADLFYGHGAASAWDEAVVLVLAVTRLPDDRAVFDTELSETAIAEIEQLCERRINERIPLAYLLGKITYAGYEFLVEHGIVIPRSPIAQLIGSGFRPWLRRDPRSIVDVCTGSGCLGILCAHVFPAASVTLIDVDPAAVGLARRNVALHGLQSRVTVVQSDLFEAVRPQTWDLIVSNPPYVDAPDFASMPPEYAHEPVSGLAGGPDGLDIVCRLLHTLPQRLRPAGLFVGEVGASSPALLRRFAQLAFVWPDLPDGGEGVFLLEADALA